MSDEKEADYLATIIYDENNKDKSLVIKNHKSNKQIEYNISSEDENYFVKNHKFDSLNLDTILKSKNLNSIREAGKNNERTSFILDRTELIHLEKTNLIEQSNELRLAESLDVYNTLNFTDDEAILTNSTDKDKEEFAELYNSVSRKDKEHGIAHTIDGDYSVQIDLDFENLAFREEVRHFNSKEIYEEVTLYNSIDEMIENVKELDFDSISQGPINDFNARLVEQWKLQEELSNVLNAHGFDTTDYEMEIAQSLNEENFYARVDFNNEDVRQFVTDNSLSHSDKRELPLQEEFIKLEKQYHVLGHTVSPEKLNEISLKLVENKLDFDKALSSDTMNNRVVTLLQSDKQLLKLSVDHLQRSKMYALLSSAKNELADIRIRNDGINGSREAILKAKIADLENRVSPPPKATLENVNAKVNSASNVRATGKSLESTKQNVHTNSQTRSQTTEIKNVKEPTRTRPKKTQSVELSR